MLEAAVGVLSIVLVVAGIGGALLASGIWLTERKFSAGGDGRSGKASRSLDSTDREKER